MSEQKPFSPLAADAALFGHDWPQSPAREQSKIVPRDPTPDMLMAASNHWRKATRPEIRAIADCNDSAGVWQTMFDAAPPQPAPASVHGEACPYADVHDWTHDGPIVSRRLNTCYVDDGRNFMVSCHNCFVAAWNDYNDKWLDSGQGTSWGPPPDDPSAPASMQGEAEYPTLARLADLSRGTVGYQKPVLELEAVMCYRERNALLAERDALAAKVRELEAATMAPSIDKAWVRFMGELGDGPDSPFPGMIRAFEVYHGQSFADKDWRSEAVTWAAAWKAAKAQP